MVGLIAFILTTFFLTGCETGSIRPDNTGPYAPGTDPKGETVDQMTVGHRLMTAGEYELALKAFSRAAGEQGLNADTLLALGTVNLSLGRLGQGEKLLRDSIKAENSAPESWNNLGVALIEQGKTAEASHVFRTAYALDNGHSDSIRDNLRFTLAKLATPAYDEIQEQEYKLVRRDSSDYLIRVTQ